MKKHKSKIKKVKTPKRLKTYFRTSVALGISSLIAFNSMFAQSLPTNYNGYNLQEIYFTQSVKEIGEKMDHKPYLALRQLFDLIETGFIKTYDDFLYVHSNVLKGVDKLEQDKDYLYVANEILTYVEHLEVLNGSDSLNLENTINKLYIRAAGNYVDQANKYVKNNMFCFDGVTIGDGFTSAEWLLREAAALYRAVGDNENADHCIEKATTLSGEQK